MRALLRPTSTISVSTDRLIEACALARAKGYLLRDARGQELKSAEQILAALAKENNFKIEKGT